MTKPSPKKPIDSRGTPKTGLGPKGGTPSWIKAAVNHAEGLVKSRDFGNAHDAGTGGIRSGLFPKKVK